MKSIYSSRTTDLIEKNRRVGVGFNPKFSFSSSFSNMVSCGLTKGSTFEKMSDVAQDKLISS